MYHIFGIHSSVEGHLVSFQHLAIINKAAMKIVEHVSLLQVGVFKEGVCVPMSYHDRNFTSPLLRRKRKRQLAMCSLNVICSGSSIGSPMIHPLADCEHPLLCLLGPGIVSQETATSGSFR